MNNFILSSVIFDSGLKLKQPEYESICESIDKNSFSLNKVLTEYKLRTDGSFNCVLNDGNRIVVNEELIDLIGKMEIDSDKLGNYMSESKENFKNVVRKILNG